MDTEIFLCKKCNTEIYLRTTFRDGKEYKEWEHKIAYRHKAEILILPSVIELILCSMLGNVKC